jgi:putative membrane protein
MLWLKAFHIIFMVTWFAGLFYLPRLFVYHCRAQEATSQARFCAMERKLFILMTIGAAGTIFFGVTLVTGIAGIPSRPALIAAHWLRYKLLLVAALLIYHVWLWTILRDFAAYRNKRGPTFYRWINEIPALFLIAIVILAVVKPAF